MASPIAEYPKTGLKVVVVGAGFGGLTAAIECYLKGHEVVILEKTPTWTQLGDIISISKWTITPSSFHFEPRSWFFVKFLLVALA